MENYLLIDNYLPQTRHITIAVAEILENPGRIHDLIRDRMAYQYLDLNGTLGWQLLDSEYDGEIENFLFFVEFVMVENNSVPMIYRAHDLYTIGQLGPNRHAFLLNQGREGQLDRTTDCLEHYEIPYTLMEHLGDTYSELEAAAGIQRRELKIGQHGFETALNNLLKENPSEDLSKTGFSYLFLSMFVCEGRRILHVRDNVTTHFAGAGMVVPENLLQYLYGWAAASHILAAYANGDAGPYNFYSVIADFGRMNIGQMAGTYDLIKQALEPRNIETDMVWEYQKTVNRFFQKMFGNKNI